MKHVDMRKLPAAAQEERRRQVIGMRERGLTYAAIAAQVGLSRTGVFDICQRFAAAGAKGLVSQPRGRKPDEQRLLDAAQEAAVRRLICRHPPDELGLPFLVEPGGGLRADPAALRGRAGGADCRRIPGALGLHGPEAAAARLRTEPGRGAVLAGRDYPAIVAAAQGARGTLFWGDETGLRSDDVRGRSYAPRGRTPVVRVCHRRAGLSLISAVSNRGALRWMVIDGAVNAAALIRFLPRLIRDVRRKVFFILDRLQVHRAGQVRDWLAAHRAKIEVFYLPAYSPELNPDEGLNADVKQAVTRKPSKCVVVICVYWFSYIC